MSDSKTGRVIALGFFDGVHVGHQALLSKAVDAATRLGARSCALTFDTHPEALITGTSIPLLSTVNDRADMMRKHYSIDEVIFAHFDSSMMQLSWTEFVKTMLIERFDAVHLVAGHDFHFGYKGVGNPQRLAELCMKLGIGCDIIGRVEIDSITVSSTYIRKLIAQGDVERAEIFLGHPHTLNGVVLHGQHLGTIMEIPTSNIKLDPTLQRPALGAYITTTLVDDIKFPSVTNIGVRPTVDGQNLCVETHILDFNADLYGKQISIELIKMLRPEQQFLNLAELRSQIKADIKHTRDYFEKSPLRIQSIS